MSGTEYVVPIFRPAHVVGRLFGLRGDVGSDRGGGEILSLPTSPQV
ncbi:MAG: hypothetical protein JWN14_1339 [Chthonomonadales bacterium]|nr:hypothetical protein [Chthonomonadales bacterium]